jgi:hypothetical protein
MYVDVNPIFSRAVFIHTNHSWEVTLCTIYMYVYYVHNQYSYCRYFVMQCYNSVYPEKRKVHLPRI